jgi:DNA-binding beta-propeller fold protein YncE
MALLALPGTASGFGFLSIFGPYGQGASQTAFPIGLAVGPDGLIYVADFENHRVGVFSADGVFVRAFGKGVNPSGGDICTTATGCQKGTKSAAAGAMDLPIGVLVDPAGTVYVADALNNRIDVFAPDGAFVRAFGQAVNPSGGNSCTTATGCQKGTGDSSAGDLAVPRGIGLGPGETLYIASGNARVDLFSMAGGFIRAFGKGVNPAGGDTCTPATGCKRGEATESAGALAGPWGVVMGADGAVAVTDTSNRRISVFDSTGAFVRAFGQGVNPAETSKVGVCTAATGCRKGSESGAPGGFTYPTSMAVDSAGYLVVADPQNHRVNRLTFGGAFVSAFGEGVVNGQPVLQICTTQTGCQRGLVNTKPGSLPNPYAATVDCAGSVYATAAWIGAEFFQIQRFGELDVKNPPCIEPTPSKPPSSSLFESVRDERPTTAKPSVRVELNKGSGTATLIVLVSDSGTLLLKGKGIRKVKRRVKKPGLIELLVVPKGALRSKLEAKGKARVKLSLTFKADNGASNTQTKSVGLKMVAPL